MDDSLRSPDAVQEGSGGTCPNDATLLAYVAGAETGERAAVLQSHLDGCHECRVLVAQLVANDDVPAAGPRVRPRTLQLDELVVGRYRVQEFVARGGMGEVYRVRDEVLGDVVALKTLTITALDDSEAALRLKQEVLLARKVTHPNVCRILEFGVHERGGDSIPFLTMEYLVGETVRQRIAKHGPLPEAEALAIVEQTVEALQAIHESGVVHRDLKGDNLFLRARERSGPHVVVMDFGLARGPSRGMSRGFSSTGRALGTADYMAPEQVMGQPATVQSDVYALGVTVFEMLTGELPFSGETPIAAAASRLLTDAPKPSSRLRAVRVPWDAFVARCLAKDPRERFADMAAVKAALAQMKSAEAAPRPRPWRLMLAVASILALGGAVWAARGLGKTPQPRAGAQIVEPPRTKAAVAPAPSPPPPPPQIEQKAADPVVAPPRPSRPKPRRHDDGGRDRLLSPFR